MVVTRIPETDAAKLIGRNYITIRNAAERGDLTRFPMQNGRQSVAKEQVELFRHKHRLMKSALSPEEVDLWYQYDEEIRTKPTLQESAILQESLIDLDDLADRIATRLIRSLVLAGPMSTSTDGISGSDIARIALSGLAAGAVTYSATKDRNFSIATGLTASVIVLCLMAYHRGEVDRDLVEQELSQLPEQEQWRWRPFVDNPGLLEDKLRELVTA